MPTSIPHYDESKTKGNSHTKSKRGKILKGGKKKKKKRVRKPLGYYISLPERMTPELAREGDKTRNRINPAWTGFESAISRANLGNWSSALATRHPTASLPDRELIVMFI